MFNILVNVLRDSVPRVYFQNILFPDFLWTFKTLVTLTEIYPKHTGVGHSNKNSKVAAAVTEESTVLKKQISKSPSWNPQ